MLEKYCNGCGKTKIISDFTRMTHSPDGLSYKCKECNKKYKEKYYANRRFAPSNISSQVCSMCGIEKSIDNFQKNSYIETGYNRSCKACKRNPQKRRPTYTYHELKTAKNMYGITIEQYAKLVKESGGKCAICGKEETKRNKGRGIRPLSVDHDHSVPGIEGIRGMICDNCNNGIARFFENEDVLKSAAEYIHYWKLNPRRSL